MIARGDLVKYKGPAGIFLAVATHIGEHPMNKGSLCYHALVIRVDEPEARPDHQTIWPGDSVYLVEVEETPEGHYCKVVAKAGDWLWQTLPLIEEMSKDGG